MEPLTIILMAWVTIGLVIVVRGAKFMQHPEIAPYFSDMSRSQRASLLTLTIIVAIAMWPFVLMLFAMVRKQ